LQWNQRDNMFCFSTSTAGRVNSEGGGDIETSSEGVKSPTVHMLVD
jgi:hypothetical protein